jgi:hypothetical protein
MLSDSTLLAPFGFTPKVARDNENFLFLSSHRGNPSCSGAVNTVGRQAIVLGNDQRDDALFQNMFMFAIDGAVIECDDEADPPCMGHPNKDRPFLPTSVYYDPIRTHYSHLLVSVRHDVLQVNPDTEFDDPVFVGTRAILSLSNPTHVTRHVDFSVLFSDNSDFSVYETSSGDSSVDSSDNWVIGKPVGSSNLYLIHFYSPCKDDSHHYVPKDTTVRAASCDQGQSEELVHEAKVMIHPDETVLVTVVAEVYAETDINLVRQRARRLSRRHGEADTHWFGGLTNKERASIVNYCADDDDGEADSDDDDSSSSSFSTSRLSDNDAFVFHYVEDHCDDPLIHSKDRRYAGRFSEEVTSSAIYSTSVEHHHDSSSSSSSSSSSHHHKHHNAEPVPEMP